MPKQNDSSGRRGVRYYVKRAEEHALGILDSCDDEAFWADDSDDDSEGADEARNRARNIVMRRIRQRWE